MSFTMDWKKLTGETKQNFAKFHKVSPETFDGFGIMGKDAKKDGLDYLSDDMKGETSIIEPPFIVAIKEILERVSKKEINLLSKKI